MGKKNRNNKCKLCHVKRKKWETERFFGINCRICGAPMIVIKEHKINISKDELLSANSCNLRKITVYMMKKHTSTSNKHIGELFRGISYSAVAKIYQRFSKQLKNDVTLRETITEIENKMSCVKG